MRRKAHLFAYRSRFQLYFVTAFLLLSIIPLMATIISIWKQDRIESNSLVRWYHSVVEPVQELRPLITFPQSWEGHWYDSDKNYHHFEKWFGDRLAFRDLMIRSKNELDYRLFRSSSRVYFASGKEIYGRHLLDIELPAVENFLTTPGNADYVRRGMISFSNALKAEGVTTLFVTPLQKEYFWPNRLPFFAPKLDRSSQFFRLYTQLNNEPQLNVVDVVGILDKLQVTTPTFYRQDFHWTNMSAMAVSTDIVNTIARWEGSPLAWSHPMDYSLKPYAGSDARFSARLFARDSVFEPQLNHAWAEVHEKTPMDASKTGLEFETNTITDKGLLPSACMFGNSFSDGMLEAGIADYFQSFTKLDRTRDMSEVPGLIRGRCKYLIVQILDLQIQHWAAFQRRGLGS